MEFYCESQRATWPIFQARVLNQTMAEWTFTPSSYMKMPDQKRRAMLKESSLINSLGKHLKQTLNYVSLKTGDMVTKTYSDATNGKFLLNLPANSDYALKAGADRLCLSF